MAGGLEDFVANRGGGARIPHTAFDTKGLAPKQAVEAWQESIGVMFDARLLDRSGEQFHARVEGFQIGELVLASCTTGAQSLDRSRFRVGRDSLDHFMIQFYTRGSCCRRDGGSDSQTRAGDLWICDLAQAQATGLSNVDSLNLVVPRRMLAPLLHQPDEHNLRIVPKENPMVGLLHSYMQGTFEAGSRMTVDQGEALIRPTVELVAAVLNGGVSDETKTGINVSLFETMTRHVRDRLNDTALSAETVAGRFGISTRKLYYLFEPHGGFAAYVQRQRLHACRRMLADPAHRQRSIADIANSFGFSRPESFSRAFRREIGMTAREVRQLAQEGGNFAGSAQADQWWHWIARMK